MYIAKVQSKEVYPNGLKVNVLFTDGKDSFIESCVPQDADGLKYFVKSKLDQLNSGPDIMAKYEVKCNNCDWEGYEEDLSLLNESNPNDKEDKSLYFFKACPNCKTDDYLMDI